MHYITAALWVMPCYDAGCCDHGEQYVRAEFRAAAQLHAMSALSVPSQCLYSRTSYITLDKINYVFM
jgi:hypothetical protein